MIPGILVSIASFPGVIVHEAAHFLFCKMRRLAVFEVCYFRFGNPAGYVLHETTEDFTTCFLVAMGPFIINSLLCLLLTFPALIPMRMFGYHDFITYFWLWLGVSIGMHAFPSTHDAAGLWSAAKKAAKNGNIFAAVSFPLVVVIYAANILSFFWFDALYGLAIGLILPGMLLDKFMTL
ncbi:MAG TPA: DUF3267 domain-containing protein [Candidatus Binatia bacterium]|jgi:hypothetical protein